MTATRLMRYLIISSKAFLEFVGGLPSAEARGKADQVKGEWGQDQIQEGGKGDLAPHRQGPVPAGRFGQDEKIAQQKKGKRPDQHKDQPEKPRMRLGPVGLG